MKSTLLLLSALLLSTGASLAAAATCDIKYTRAACPGKEAESFKKCDGKVSCNKIVAAASAEVCRSKAVAACANDRIDITKSKIINASFDGKPIMSKAGGADHCQDYAAKAEEFNQCGK